MTVHGWVAPIVLKNFATSESLSVSIAWNSRAWARPFVPVVASEVAPPKCAVRLGAELPNGVKLELGAADSGDLAVLLRLLCELPCSGSTPG